MLQKIIMLIGIILFMIVSGNAVENASIILNLKSALLVLAGSLLSAFIAFPMKTFRIFNPEDLRSYTDLVIGIQYF